MSAWLEAWVPTNRYADGRTPTHMDGWNEILASYRRSRYAGNSHELENVQYVAHHVRKAMRAQHWGPMRDEGSAVPCAVWLTFVERDRRRDLGNIHGGAKYVLDALTHRHRHGAGAIYDDSQRWLREVTYRVEVDPANPGVLIKVRRLGEVDADGT